MVQLLLIISKNQLLITIRLEITCSTEVSATKYDSVLFRTDPCTEDKESIQGHA